MLHNLHNILWTVGQRITFADKKRTQEKYHNSKHEKSMIRHSRYSLYTAKINAHHDEVTNQLKINSESQKYLKLEKIQRKFDRNLDIFPYLLKNT